jgi:cell division protein ZapA
MIDLRNIHVKIGDREYPLQIPAEEEEKVRNAAKELNERIEYYKKSIGTSDRIDLLSMVAFDSMVQFLSGKEDAKKQEQQIKLRIESLDNLIASVLQD